MKKAIIQSAAIVGLCLMSIAAFAQFLLPSVTVITSAATTDCSSVTNLVAWYKSSGIVGGPNVTAWNDSSSGARNMTCTNNPQRFIMFNSVPGVQFNGTNNKCQSTGFTLAQPLTIYAIAKFTSIGAAVRALESTTGTGTPNWVERTTTVGWNGSGGDGLSITPTANTTYFVHAVCNGATNSLMALDSNADTTGSCGGTDSMSAINLGGGNSADFANVAFGEVCVYSKSIGSGSSDDTTIRSYFTGLWAKP